MENWRSKTEDEAIFESAVLAEICLIHHVFFKLPLRSETTLLFVKCKNSTLFDISKMYKPLYISNSCLKERKLIIYEKKKFFYFNADNADFI